MVKEIVLTKGKIALVDDKDFPVINLYSWYAMNPYGDLWYAAHKDYNIITLMHKLIIGLDVEVDHIDFDGLNNQRHNLRRCTSSQNKQHTRKRTGVTSCYKGVSWYKNYEKWRATINIRGRQISLGYHNTEEDAARAYNDTARELFGEFALLNTIKE